MKIAEALMQRDDLKRHLEDLNKRLLLNARHQEGEKPSEGVKAMLEDYNQCLSSLTALVLQIKRANNRLVLADGMPLVEALTQRSALLQQHEMLTALADRASELTFHHGRSELRLLPSVDVRALRQQAEVLYRRYRQLDLAIQQLNWLEDL